MLEVCDESAFGSLHVLDTSTWFGVCFPLSPCDAHENLHHLRVDTGAESCH